MRALVLIAVLGAVASAAPPRTLDQLITQGRLDAEGVTRELAKLRVAAKFVKPIAPASCAVTRDSADLVVQCSERVCPGACQVRRNEATIRVRNGTWSVVATAAKRLGDTGECGCCM